MRAELHATREERDRLRAANPPSANASGDTMREAARLVHPSFFAQYETLRRVRDAAEQQAGRRHPIWDANAKLAGRDLARQLGVAVPTLLAGPAPLARLAPPTDGRFVMKPVEGSSARGVFALTRHANGFYSVLDDTHYTWGDITEIVQKLHADGQISEMFIIEELVEGTAERTLPYDFKCYCFGGEVELVMQKDACDSRMSAHARFKFWDRTFTDLGAVRHADKIDPSLPAPSHPAELIAAAETVASALPSTFVRVDLYNPPSGVVFGEITPHPGGTQLFDPATDRMLGDAWERAKSAELARDITGNLDM